MDTTPSPRTDSTTADLLPTLHRVVVINDADDDRLHEVRRAAPRLGVDHGWELVVYDRSEETWMDHPHPSGPFSAADLADQDDRADLHRLLADIESAGVTASAWTSTVPSISAIADVVQKMEIDAVLIPSEFGSHKLADRLLSGDEKSSVAASLSEICTGDGPRLLEMRPDGLIAEPEVTTAAS